MCVYVYTHYMYNLSLVIQQPILYSKPFHQLHFEASQPVSVGLYVLPSCTSFSFPLQDSFKTFTFSLRCNIEEHWHICHCKDSVLTPPALSIDTQVITKCMGNRNGLEGRVRGFCHLHKDFKECLEVFGERVGKEFEPWWSECRKVGDLALLLPCFHCHQA